MIDFRMFRQLTLHNAFYVKLNIKNLAECEAFKEHVDVVLKVLKEKYKEDEYRIFEGNYINKQSLRSVADEYFCSHMHVKRVSGKIKADFDVLTDILTDCEDSGL